MQFRFVIIFLLAFVQSGMDGYCVNKRLPVVIRNNGENTTPLIFHITGDGGMVRFDTKLCRTYRNNGYSFIALSSLKYFLTVKSPTKVARDMIPLIERYFKDWNKEEIILVGFSFGAEITPFLFEQLPEELKEKVKLVVLLTPAKTSDFRIHLRDMIGFDKKNEVYNVADETAKIKSTKILAVYGKKEKHISLKDNKQANLKILFIRGGHDFKDNNFVFDLIMNELDTSM
jgi:type IV secretory pathway VirJ component